jgi:hypothetical protein
MPMLRYPYNYCDRDDGAQTWATVTEYEMRSRRFQTHSLRSSFALMAAAMRRLTLAIGGQDD